MDYMPVRASSIVKPNSREDWNTTVPPAMKRRDPRIWQMAYVSARQAVDAAGCEVNSIITGTALGALNETKNYLDGVFKDGFGSPRNFIASVHNSMAGKLALELNVAGPNITVCEGQNSLAATLVAASLLKEDAFPCLIVCVDENIELLQELTPHLSDACQRFLQKDWVEAAVAFVVDRPGEKSYPSLGACGPAPATLESANDLFASWARECGEPTASIMPLDESNTSFLSPAIAAHEHLKSGAGNCQLIPSYSPPAQGAALVLVCA